jgi:hypothetical protein
MEIISKGLANFHEMKGKYPEVVYKYRVWDDENHKKVITNQELYYSPPSKFPDPNDCKGAIQYNLLTKEERIKFIEYKIRENNTGQSRNFYRSESRRLFKTSPLRDNNKINELNRETFEEFNQRFGVLCLTPNPKIMKMWNDYSNDHKGFCVGYYSEYLFEQLGGGCKVFYEKELPVIYPNPIHSQDEQHIYQVYFKEEKWSFEDEYRTHTFNISPLSKEDRTVIVNPRAFKELILGAKLSSEEKQEIVNSIPSILNQIQILKADIVNETIELKNYS